ncbi:hypothetical protein TWF718_006440 [Orbilia javanica]|uniref:Uncharacterized protein n=1 Tax=Orbilia javanica TaxID=47235 RepID=A0AAN8N0T1_9PEZI
MCSSMLSDSPSRQNSYSSYNGSSDRSSLDDRETVLSLNLKDDYLLPHSSCVLDIDDSKNQKVIERSSFFQAQENEEKINEVIGYYKEKYKMKYRSRYKWKYRELLKHMESKRGMPGKVKDTNSDTSPIRDRGQKAGVYQANKYRGNDS